LSIILCFISCSLLCRGQEFLYMDKEGEEEKQIHISKKLNAGSHLLILTSSHKYSKHIYPTPGYTSSWQLKDTISSHDFLVERFQNTLSISGKYAGGPISKTVEIDDKPWINKLDHGLSAWVLSDEDELVFWALRLSSDLDPIEFEAEKVDREEIFTPAGSFRAIKVKLRLHGFFISNLWSATLWYREKDGLFIKYQGDSGPGTSLRTIELENIL